MAGLARFYCPGPLQTGQQTALPAAAAHHAARVLRLSRGDTVCLFDGRGGEYFATISRIEKAQVWVRITEWREVQRESSLGVTLAQALVAVDKMVYTIQKAVELGVSAIQPIATQRSVVKLSGERADKRCEHWRQVAVAACEQSGRDRIASVAEIESMPNWLGHCPQGMRLLLSPRATTTLRDLSWTDQAIVLLAGPEGGFTEDEVAAAQTVGFIAVRLGPRILRTETAALAALAAMQVLWGDFAK